MSAINRLGSNTVNYTSQNCIRKTAIVVAIGLVAAAVIGQAVRLNWASIKAVISLRSFEPWRMYRAIQSNDYVEINAIAERATNLRSLMETECEPNVSLNEKLWGCPENERYRDFYLRRVKGITSIGLLGFPMSRLGVQGTILHLVIESWKDEAIQGIFAEIVTKPSFEKLFEVQDLNENTPLHRAIGNPAYLIRLVSMLESGVLRIPLDKSGNTLLHIACDKLANSSSDEDRATWNEVVDQLIRKGEGLFEIKNVFAQLPLCLVIHCPTVVLDLVKKIKSLDVLSQSLSPTHGSVLEESIKALASTSEQCQSQWDEVIDELIINSPEGQLPSKDGHYDMRLFECYSHDPVGFLNRIQSVKSLEVLKTRLTCVAGTVMQLAVLSCKEAEAKNNEEQREKWADVIDELFKIDPSGELLLINSRYDMEPFQLALNSPERLLLRVQKASLKVLSQPVNDTKDTLFHLACKARAESKQAEIGDWDAVINELMQKGSKQVLLQKENSFGQCPLFYARNSPSLFLTIVQKVKFIAILGSSVNRTRDNTLHWAIRQRACADEENQIIWDSIIDEILNKDAEQLLFNTKNKDEQLPLYFAKDNPQLLLSLIKRIQSSATLELNLGPFSKPPLEHAQEKQASCEGLDKKAWDDVVSELNSRFPRLKLL